MAKRNFTVYNGPGEKVMPGRAELRCRKASAVLAIALPLWLALPPAPPPSMSKDADVPRLLRQIRDEVLGLEKYPGEDFSRGEFHLGEGDDDTNKTHAVGVLVSSEAEGFRMTIMISRLEPARENPRIRYARDSKTLVCRFAGDAVELVRSDYSVSSLEDLLPAVLRAIIDKKNLLRK
jgi:hypothetical protein